MRIADCRTVGVALFSLFVLAGCGGDGGPSLYSATGTVKYKDKAINKANVMFSPEKGPPALGQTDENGYFKLATNGKSGAIAGKGVWTITAFEDYDLPPPMSADEAGKLAQQGKLPVVTAKSSIPEKYGVSVTSGLNMEVTTSSSKNKFDIVLTD